MPTKIKKGPPVGYDKRNPNQKPLASKSFILPNLLADVSSKHNQHPFFSEELGGNMLNLNQIFNGTGSDKNQKKITACQSAPHISMPGDSLRQHSPSYIQVSLSPSYRFRTNVICFCSHLQYDHFRLNPCNAYFFFILLKHCSFFIHIDFIPQTLSVLHM